MICLKCPSQISGYKFNQQPALHFHTTQSPFITVKFECTFDCLLENYRLMGVVWHSERLLNLSTLLNLSFFGIIVASAKSDIIDALRYFLFFFCFWKQGTSSQVHFRVLQREDDAKSWSDLLENPWFSFWFYVTVSCAIHPANITAELLSGSASTFVWGYAFLTIFICRMLYRNLNTVDVFVIAWWNLLNIHPYLYCHNFKE